MRNPEMGPQPEDELSPKESEPEVEKGRGEIVTYTPEEVTAYLTEGKFIEALQTASDVTYDTGHESGFIVFGSKDKQLYIPYVTEGGTAQQSGQPRRSGDLLRPLAGRWSADDVVGLDPSVGVYPRDNRFWGFFLTQ